MGLQKLKSQKSLNTFGKSCSEGHVFIGEMTLIG